jgi:hypothetical protein
VTGELKFSRIPARAAGMELTATDWAVLHVICLHADKAGHAYPSLARIAALARIRRNHVSRSTKRLKELGLLRSKRVSRGSGWANTRYEIVYQSEIDMAPQAGLLIKEVAPEMGLPDLDRGGGTSDGARWHLRWDHSGTSGGALTDHLTDHRTELTKEEASQEESLSGGYVTSNGDTVPFHRKRAATGQTHAGKPNGRAAP